MRVLAGLLSTVACLFAASTAHASDRVVVRFSGSADSADRSAARKSVDATSGKSLPGLTGVQVVTVPEGDAKSAARALDNTDGVLWAQPEHRMHVSAVALPTDARSQSEEQWGLHNTGQTTYDSYFSHMFAGEPGVDGDFIPAWQTTTGAGQTLAVVDTGVDFSIDDLGVNESSSAAFVTPNDCPTDSSMLYHGTHVAGIAAASLAVNQDHDITGGAPDAKIMALRALNGAGCGSDADIAAAFSWAADHGAKVINASLGGAGYSAVLHQAIASHPNTLFVVAAGNAGADEDSLAADKQDYPCADPGPNVVCVAAVNSRGDLAGFSNRGLSTVDVGAPGEGIVSYVPGGGVKYDDGTSMATPFVSAAAALAFAAQPCSTPEQVRSALIGSAHALPDLDGKTVSGGMLDTAALLARNGATSPEPRLCSVTTLPPTGPMVGRATTASAAFNGGAVTWRWERCTATCTSIAGATRSTYTPQAADVGRRLRATATASNAAGSTSSTSALSTAVVAAPVKPAPVVPKPAPIATPTPTPTPIVKRAAPASPQLALYKPHRRGRRLAISGKVARAFYGTVTIKLCTGRRCRIARVKANSGKFAARVRPSRRGRVVVTASVRAGSGFKAASAKRTVRFF